MSNSIKLIYILLYVLLIFAYFYTETAGKFTIRAINKILLSSMFFLVAIAGYLHSQEGYKLLLLLGVGFAFLADIVIMYKSVLGGVFFLVANIVLSVYAIGLITENASLILYFLIWLLFVFPYFLLCHCGFLKTGKMKIPFTIYMLSITMLGSLGLLLLMSNGHVYLYFAIGAIMFCLSDYLIAVDLYSNKKRNWVLRTNSLLYFLGMLAIATSIWR